MYQKRIGNITLDYTFYNPEIHYSDGKIEEILLEAAKNNSMDELLHTSNNWAVLYHCSDIRENLLDWYPFNTEGSLLEIGSGCGALTGLFAQKVKNVTCIELSERRSLINAYRNQQYNNVSILLGSFEDIKITEKYDYITLIGVWEYAGLYVASDEPYMDMLKIVKRYLKPNGKLLIAIENRMGLKYWNGALEDHTGIRYSGLNDYINEKKVRTFSKPELEKILKEVGFSNYKFYYPNPDYKLPDAIYSDEKLPLPGEIRNYRMDFDNPRVYNFNDATVVDQLCDDEMFAYFSNSFLVECGENYSDVIYAKYNRIRKKQFCIATIISKEAESRVVRKKALSDDAKIHIKNISLNSIGDMTRIKKVNGRLENEEYVSECIEGISAEAYLYRYRRDTHKFVEQTKNIINSYLNTNGEEMIDFYLTPEYEKVYGKSYVEGGKCLKRTNVDLIFSNLILTNEKEIYCIDNEWVYDFPIPYEYVLWRALSQLYVKYIIYLRGSFSMNEFLVELGLNCENFDVYAKMESSYSQGIWAVDYRHNYRKPTVTMDARIFM